MGATCTSVLDEVPSDGSLSVVAAVRQILLELAQNLPGDARARNPRGVLHKVYFTRKCCVSRSERTIERAQRLEYQLLTGWNTDFFNRWSPNEINRRNRTTIRSLKTAMISPLAPSTEVFAHSRFSRFSGATPI